MAKSPQELYQEREKRIQDATELKIPDRIPFVPQDTGLFSKYTGLTWEEAMYDAGKYIAALKKTVIDFDFDAYYPPLIMTSGTFNDVFGFRQLKWAGAKDEDSRTRPNTVFQFVEPGSLGREPMSAEDYDWFLDDPTDYIIRRHWPHISKKLEPFQNLPPIHSIVSYYVGIPQLLPVFGTPEIAATFEALSAAGQEVAKWSTSLGPFFEDMGKSGYPPIGLAIGIAPYDYFADFLRGKKGCMIDMYRCPDKLKRAVDRVTPWIIDWVLTQARMFSDICKRVFIPIHAASGGFMSEEQHKEFFWPSLRKVIMALIDEGFTPAVETQGIYTDRFETIRDVPKGKVIYMIESDLFKAKEILGDTACLIGGPPPGIMSAGSPEEVKDYCKKVIDVVGKDGGFIMATAVPVITDKPENIKAVAEFTREYGVYK
jgi:hypothetical protein